MTVEVQATEGGTSVFPSADSVEFVMDGPMDVMNVVDQTGGEVVRSYLVDHIVWYQVN